MPELARLASFLLFLALGLQLRRRREGAARRRAILRLLAYVVGLSLASGLSQQDDWPFTSHTIAVGRARASSRVCQTEFYGVDALAREWRLDPYTWTPVYDSILQYWAEQHLPRLTPAERSRALGFLLSRAERSRMRLVAGKPLGPQRLLGPAGAPYWLLLPRRQAAPEERYVALRAYASCWLPVEAAVRPDAVSRTLTLEYRP